MRIFILSYVQTCIWSQQEDTAIAGHGTEGFCGWSSVEGANNFQQRCHLHVHGVWQDNACRVKSAVPHQRPDLVVSNECYKNLRRLRRRTSARIFTSLNADLPRNKNSTHTICNNEIVSYVHVDVLGMVG